MSRADLATSRVLALGIGNVLWADEGFGVRCAEAFAALLAQGGLRLGAGQTWLGDHNSAVDALWQSKDGTPGQLRVLDGGTQGLYLLPYVQSATHLLVFDAIDYGLLPGTMKLVSDDAVPRFMGAKKMSLHQTGFQEVIAAAMLTEQCPQHMLLIGVQPVELEDYGGSLRASVKAQIPVALAHALTQLQSWGIALSASADMDTLLKQHWSHTPTEGSVEHLAYGDAAMRHDAASRPLAMGSYEAGRPSEDAACRVGDSRVWLST